MQFSQQQKNAIEQMVAMNDIAGAQAIILQELKVQFGGAAEAMAQTPAGRLANAMLALSDALKVVGAVISPYITQLAAAIKGTAQAFQQLPGPVATTIVGSAACWRCWAWS